MPIILTIVIFYLLYTYYVSNLCSALYIYCPIYFLQQNESFHLWINLLREFTVPAQGHTANQQLNSVLNISLVRVHKFWNEVFSLIFFLKPVCIFIPKIIVENKSVLISWCLNCNSSFVFPAAYVGRNVILTSGCIIGACCNLNTFEVIPENTVIYGVDCLRRVQTERPQVL